MLLKCEIKEIRPLQNYLLQTPLKNFFLPLLTFPVPPRGSFKTGSLPPEGDLTRVTVSALPPFDCSVLLLDDCEL